jgi:hypothetical protein
MDLVLRYSHQLKYNVIDYEFKQSVKNLNDFFKTKIPEHVRTYLEMDNSSFTNPVLNKPKDLFIRYVNFDTDLASTGDPKINMILYRHRNYKTPTYDSRSITFVVSLT